MNTFYLRTQNQAILIGDRDIAVKSFGTDTHHLVAHTLSVSEDYGDYNCFYSGTEENCQKLLDWILVQAEKNASSIDARNFIQSLGEQKKETKSSKGFVHPTEGWVSSNCPN